MARVSDRLRAIAAGFDRELWQGVAALTGVGLATVVGLTMLVARDAHPTVRVFGPLVAFLVAITLASTNWRPRSLRWTAVLAAVLLAALLGGIGRDVRLHEPTDEAAAELRSLATALDALDAPLRELQTRLDGEVDAAVDALRDAIAATNGAVGAHGSSELIGDANEVVRAIEALDESALADALRDFHGDLPATPAPAIVALQESVEAANAAYARRAEPPQKSPVEEAIADACAAVNSAAPDDPCVPEPVGVLHAKDSYPVALTIARLRLAEYRNELFGRPEDEQAVKDARQAVAAAQATSPMWETPQIGVGEAIRAGAEHMVPGPRWSATPGLALAIEPVAWVLFAILALAFWRGVERRSSRQFPGPVEVELTPFTAKDDDSSDIQKATFRAAVLRNIPEPGSVPGATLLQSLTDLAELVTPATTWLSTLATTLKNLLNAPVGYSVTGEVLPPVDPGTDWKVLVRVEDRATGKDEAVASISGKTPPQACRAAGYWAAAAVLARSTRTPRWARWTTASSAALAAYDDSGDIGARELPVADLARAVAAAPDSGVLLHRLADTCDLNGDHLDALSLYARAVSAHPRYPTARYRLAVSVTMLSRSTDHWTTSTSAQRTRIAGQLYRAGRNIGVSEGTLELVRLLPSSSEAEAQATLETVAGELFGCLEKDTSRRRTLAATLRKSERDVFWPARLATHGVRRARNRRRWIVKSAMLAAAEGIAPDRDVERVEHRAERTGSFWQLSYNLACYYATRPVPNPQEAMKWLEIALERPGSGQMAGGWLKTDPDLQSLGGSPQFSWLLQQVDDSRKVAQPHA